MIARLAAVILACTATAVAGKVLTVAEVVTRHVELDGRMIDVRGWLRECRHLSCFMSDTREGDPALDKPGSFVSVGHNAAIETELSGLSRSKIVLRARVSAFDFSHLSPDGTELIITTDRADQLMPLKVVRVIRRVPPLSPEIEP